MQPTNPLEFINVHIFNNKYIKSYFDSLGQLFWAKLYLTEQNSATEFLFLMVNFLNKLFHFEYKIFELGSLDSS